VVLPAEAADDFAEFCQRNPRPCPLLERLPAGDPEPTVLAPGADLRRDLPRYRQYTAGGAVTEHSDIEGLWRRDAVAFLLGCSFSFEGALARAGLVPRHWEEGCNVPMYRTTQPTRRAGRFGGPLVVSMRPIPASRLDQAYRITAEFPTAHGAPVHHAEPSVLGIGDLGTPDWGDAVTINAGEVPVFWACGVTGLVAVQTALGDGTIPWAITHAPGHMFITDQPSDAAPRA